MAPIAPRNGKRVACVGAGPASLTVARDLAPLGYELTIFDSEAKAGGFMWTQIPRFRLPETVIDEEAGYILDMGVNFVSQQRIESMAELMGQGYDAIFVGCGAPRGRDLDLPGRKEAASQIHIGIDWLASVSFGHVTAIGRRVPACSRSAGRTNSGCRSSGSTCSAWRSWAASAVDRSCRGSARWCAVRRQILGTKSSTMPLSHRRRLQSKEIPCRTPRPPPAANTVRPRPVPRIHLRPSGPPARVPTAQPRTPWPTLRRDWAT